MDYRTTYRSFINSYYLSEGIRITAGLTLPTIIGTWLHHENIGITMSIGAVCVTMVDNAGPVLHRINAMLVCNAGYFYCISFNRFRGRLAIGDGSADCRFLPGLFHDRRIWSTGRIDRTRWSFCYGAEFYAPVGHRGNCI